MNLAIDKIVIEKINDLKSKTDSTECLNLLRKTEHKIISSFIQTQQVNDYAVLFGEISSNPHKGIVVGKFSSSYNKTLGLDAFQYERLLPNILIPNDCKNIFPVIIKEHTVGFSDKGIVAVFPETFEGNKVLATDPVFYFINRFSNRFEQYTKKIISLLGLESLFEELFEIENTEVYITNWVLLHEHFHRTGLMPIPRYLYEKSSKITAGFEELRSDLLSMLYCLKNKNDSDYLRTLKMILAERMFVYPVVRNINSFDSISSIVLHNVLKSCRTLDEIEQSIINLHDKIRKIEKKSLKISSRVERKEFLSNYFLEIFNESIDSYCFFEKLKRELL